MTISQTIGKAIKQAIQSAPALCECTDKTCPEHAGAICQNLDVQAYTIKNDETGVERSINLCGDCIYDLANSL